MSESGDMNQLPVLEASILLVFLVTSYYMIWGLLLAPKTLKGGGEVEHSYTYREV